MSALWRLRAVSCQQVTSSACYNSGEPNSLEPDASAAGVQAEVLLPLTAFLTYLRSYQFRVELALGLGSTHEHLA